MRLHKAILFSGYIWGSIISPTFANPELSEALLDYTVSLLARQTDPAACATSCQDSFTVINDCITGGASAACLCTVPNSHLLQQCIDCSTMINDPTAIPTAQKIATSFNTLCVSSASTIQPLTVSGGTPSGSGTSGATIGGPLTNTPNPSTTIFPDPIPSSPPGQITIGPPTATAADSSSPSSTDITPPPKGSAMKTTMAPTFELGSLLILLVTFFSL